MRTSLVLAVRKGIFSSFMRSSASSKSTDAPEADGPGLSKEQQDKLKGKLSSLRKQEEKPASDMKLRDVHDDDNGEFGENYMDSIRARSLLKYRYNYTPPADVEVVVKTIAGEYDTLSCDPQRKAGILNSLGIEFGHFVPSCSLHKMKTIEDLLNFYRQEVKNINKYSEMARDETLPVNLNIREHPRRFHPNDIGAPHAGVTAFPGVGGQVFGLRNKRIYRQFNPRKEWFDYEDMSFDYEKVDKDMPWDPEVVKRMDSFVDKKYKLKSRSFQRTTVREI
uniref:Large ribosomal subunit protein mL50 n=1 Tax=Steinernema glaseri TaxID=37863 RepID=A0A1I7Z9K8_9BILA